MNITQALNVALPELPAKLMSERPPRVHPDVVFNEHIEEGKRVVRAYVPGVDSIFTFPPDSWALIQLFDGQRSHAEISDLCSRELGIPYSEETVREFAAEVEATNFWYRTPQEKNIKLMQKTADERRRLQKKKNRWGDLSEIRFSAVNPDRFLTWLYRQISFMYTPWFTVLTLLAFAFTAGIFVTHWSEVGRDTLEFYNFADKSWFRCCCASTRPGMDSAASTTEHQFRPWGSCSFISPQPSTPIQPRVRSSPTVSSGW